MCTDAIIQVLMVSGAVLHPDFNPLQMKQIIKSQGGTADLCWLRASQTAAANEPKTKTNHKPPALIQEPEVLPEALGPDFLF